MFGLESGRRVQRRYNLSETTLHIHISGNFKGTIMADHILELAGIGMFCYYKRT